MTILLPLWLPILLSAGAVWIVATILGMPFLHHKNDFIGLPAQQEDDVVASLRKSGIKPGNYLFPDFRTREAMETEAVKKALAEGPVGHLSVWKTPLTIGDKMLATLLVHLVVCVLIAYITRVAMPGAASFSKVFQVATTAGVLAYCFSFIPSAIWWGSYKRAILANIFDGLVFAAIIGAIFAWRWPR